METQSKDERAADWARLKAESEKTYKPHVRIVSTTLAEREEQRRLAERLAGITIEIARIGAKGIDSRARVFRGSPETGRELYDSGECRTDTMESRLTKFLAQQLHAEAMMAAR